MNLSCLRYLPLYGAILCFGTPALGADPRLPQTGSVVTAPWATETHNAKKAPTAVDSYSPPALPKVAAPAPLSAEDVELLHKTVQNDRLPTPTWMRFVVSNEWRHDVTFPRLFGLGGVHIGVATDQNYTIAAASGAELVVLMDYDLEVVRLHRLYHALILEAETPGQFRAFFDENQDERVALALSTHPKGPGKEKAQLLRIYKQYRERLQIYLRHVEKLRVGNRHPTWLGDPDAYSYIRSLVKGHRVLAVQGDLNGSQALKSIGNVARALKLPVRLVYLSNAEGFFKYSKAFADNLGSLPRDARTVVFRTYKHRFPAPLGDSWHYNLHSLEDFLHRMEQPGYGSIHPIMGDLRGPKGRAAINPLGTSYYDATIPYHR